MYKEFVVVLIACVAIVVICYYCWFSPLFILCAGIITLTEIVCFLYFICKREDVRGCWLISLLPVAILLVVAMYYDDECYVSSFCGEKHVYVDCDNAANAKLYKIGKFSALIWGCIDDCASCAKRELKEQQEESKRRAEQWIVFQENQKEQDLEFIDGQIAELDSIRHMIEIGEDVDVSEYEFRYVVEDEYEMMLEDVNSDSDDEIIFEPRRFR